MSLDKKPVETADIVVPVDKGKALFYPNLIDTENESGGESPQPRFWHVLTLVLGKLKNNKRLFYKN